MPLSNILNHAPQKAISPLGIPLWLLRDVCHRMLLRRGHYHFLFWDFGHCFDCFFRFIGLKLWISVWVFICGMSGISVWYIDSIGDLIPGMWKFYGSWWFCIQFSILIKNICSFEVLDVFFTVLWFLIDPNAPWLIAIHSLKGALITVSAFANKASRNVTKTNLFTLSFKSVKRYFLSR